MYCGYCGKQIEEEALFFPQCGKKQIAERKSEAAENPIKVVKREIVTEKGQNSLLYESKGCNQSQMVGMTAMLIISVLCAIMCFGLTGARHPSSGVSFGYYSNGVYHETETGSIGGGAVFNSDGKKMLMILGSVMIGTACLFAQYLVGMNRCWVKIYKDHIEGQGYILGFNKNQFYCTFSEISEVLIQGKFIVITAGKTRHLLVCREQRAAFDLLNRCRSKE